MERQWGLLLLLVVVTALAPPGLPACWLELEPCTLHPHPAHHPDVPHSHEYLLEDVQAVPAAAVPSVVIPAYLLIALLGQSSVWFKDRRVITLCSGWKCLVDPPPPRLFHS